MSKADTPLVGIVGGMSPSATVYLQQLILQYTNAKNDQDHVPFLLFMNPKISSRQEEDSGYIQDIHSSITKLEFAGATHIALACYSTYVGIEEIKSKMRSILIDVPALAIEWISQHVSKEKVGLLAAPKVLSKGLFQKPLESLGYSVITPVKEVQKQYVEKAIYDPTIGIKSGHTEAPRELIAKAIQHLESRGAKKIIFGCTDLPVAYSTDNENIIDPMRILAKYIISLYKLEIVI